MLKQAIIAGIVATVVGGVALWWLEPLLKPAPPTPPTRADPPIDVPGQLIPSVPSADKPRVQPPAATPRPLPEKPEVVVAPPIPEPSAKPLRPANAAPARTEPSLRTFDGQWFSAQFKYGFRIEANIGTATQSNSPKFAPGDVILRFERLSETEFHGEQVFTDGRWNKVSGRLDKANTLTMTGGGYVWTMSRQ